MLPSGLLSRLISQTRARPEVFTRQLRQLLGAIATGGWFGTDEIAHCNGGLFDDDAVLPLERDGMDILAGICALDWSSIEPSILGTLFERSLDPSKRAQLGAHYTSRDDILLIVEPVLMAPLHRRWQEIRAQAMALAERRDAVAGGQRTRLENELRAGPALSLFSPNARDGNPGRKHTSTSDSALCRQKETRHGIPHTCLAIARSRPRACARRRMRFHAPDDNGCLGRAKQLSSAARYCRHQPN